MNNHFRSIQKLLELLRIKRTNSFLKDSLFSHPDYPSLLSISDTLTKYDIDNMAVKIAPEKLKEIPFPCMVQIHKEGVNLFYILKSYKEEEVSFYDEFNQLKTLKTVEFLENWTGVCLLVEKKASSKEPGINEKLIKKKLILTSSVIILSMVLLSAIVDFSALYLSVSFTVFSSRLVYLLLSLSGMVTGLFLLWYELDKQNPALQSFCSNGKKVNCDYVLNSKYAGILSGTLQVSILVFAYFFANATLFIRNSFTSETFMLLKLLGILSIPAIIYSFYIQAFVLKKWCRFCMLVQLILLIQSLFSFNQEISYQEITLKDVSLFAVFFLVPIALWLFIKPLVDIKKTTNLYRRSFQKMKNNKIVFESILSKSKKITTDPAGLGILLKNEKSKYHVIKVCNPYCGPCAKAHPILEELCHKGLIDLQMIFTARADESDVKFKPVNHLLAIDNADSLKTPEALSDWYMADKKDYQSFAGKYPMNGELQEQVEKIQKMRNWCDSERIAHTPTIFINGYELTQDYTISDLKEVLT